MNDSFESDERKRKETIECLYWSLMNGWDIPKDIREHYGFSEDYELYHRLESMEPEDYRERRLRGEIPDAIEVDVRLTHAVEKVFERLCSPPPVQYLDKLYGELEKLENFFISVVIYSKSILYKIHVASKKQIRNKTVFFDNSVFFSFHLISFFALGNI